MASEGRVVGSGTAGGGPQTSGVGDSPGVAGGSGAGGLL